MPRDRLTSVAATLVGVLAAACCTVMTSPAQVNTSTSLSSTSTSTAIGGDQASLSSSSSSSSSSLLLVLLDQLPSSLPNRLSLFGDASFGVLLGDHQDSGEEGEPAPPSETPDWCPSYCNASGRRYAKSRCTTSLPFCCKVLGDGLLVGVFCCDDEENKVDDNIEDDFNCSDSRWWSTVLGVCVPVGSICFVGVILLCAYQHRARLRRRLVVARGLCCCLTSSSTVGDSSSTARRPSDCSTVSHRSPAITPRQRNRTASNSMDTTSVHRQLEPTALSTGVLGPSCESLQLGVAPLYSISYPADEELSRFRFIPSETVARNGVDVPSVFVLQVEPTQPPPYVTVDEPPSYATLYPTYPT